MLKQLQKKSAKIPFLRIGVLPEAPVPLKVKPMLATLIEKPFNAPGWIFEIKWDGYRMISRIKNGGVNLISRNLNSFNAKYPGIRNEIKKINYDAVLDGEVVAIDSNGNPSFQLLQNYQRTGTGNIVYYVFDLLWLEGHCTDMLPVTRRKEILQSIL